VSSHARHAASAEASRVTSAKATDVTPTKASHGASAEATHVTSAETATAAVSSASATASAATTRLGTRRKQRPGQQRGCQYHHRSSSSHDILSFQRANPRVIIEAIALTTCGGAASNR
jgi:hypothetical protein